MSDEAGPSGCVVDTFAKKRTVSVSTVEKWIAENDASINTITWLGFDRLTGNHECVASLKCKICIRYKERLVTCRNYNTAFIEGSSNLRISAVKDHSRSVMHARAMSLFSKSQGKPVTEYAPIVKALNFLDAVTEQRLKKKFDIAYFICKQRLAFSKMGPLCELQARHGVDIGSNYTNNLSCTTFVEFIALEQRDILKNLLERKFFSIQCDGSTDSGNMEEEQFLVMYLDTRADDGRVHIRNRFFAVRQPTSGNAEGLFDALNRAFVRMDIADSDWKNRLVGLGCDGTNVNMGLHDLRGHIEESVPWVVTIWCLAHRLELALKDALLFFHL